MKRSNDTDCVYPVEKNIKIETVSAVKADESTYLMQQHQQQQQ